MAASPAAIARCQAHEKYIVATYHTLTVAEQAQRRGLSETQVRRLRMRLARAGRIDLSKRARSPLWSDAEYSKLVSLLRSGYSVRAAAHAIGRSADAVWIQLNARGTTPTDLYSGYVWNMSEVIALFCADDYIVRNWIDQGKLQGRSDSAQRGAEWLTTRRQIEAFLSDRTAWPTYNPKLITDPIFRAYARGERIKAGGDWITLAAYAMQQGYHVDTIRRKLPRMNIVSIRIGNTRYVWQANP